MGRLADNPDWRENIASQARDAAEGESVEALGDELEALYGSVLGRRRAAAPSDPLRDRP